MTVHGVGAAGQVIDHLYLYNPRTADWRHLVNTPGTEGAGYMSPDDSRVAFIFAPNTQPTQLRPWITNLQTGETTKLTRQDTEEGAWDGYLTWRPDGQEIVFLRLRRVTGGLTATLMLVSSSGGEPTELLESGEWIFAACYAPDGKRLAVLTKTGLELVELSSRQRKLILGWDSLQDPQFRTGGLIWSRSQNKIAFAILNRQAKKYEIWTTTPHSQAAKKIFEQDESKGQITVTSFVDR